MPSWRALLAELIGTFLLVFVAAGVICTDSYTRGGVSMVGIALATGLGLMVLVYAFGPISGAQFNPAVSIAFAVVGRMPAIAAGAYVAVQLVGGVLAGLVLRLIFAQVYPEAVIGAAHLGTTGLARDASFGLGVLIEAILTFALLLAIYGSAIDHRAPPGVAGLAIGMVIAADILVGGYLTGASMNPARTLGPAVGAQFWDNHLVFWIGPILGALLAALIYEFAFLQRDPPPAEPTAS